MMPVDQNNYQVSSSRRKLEIIIMKLLLLFMFVAVAVELAIGEEVSSQYEVAVDLSHRYNISLTDGADCVKKSGATSEDIIYLEKCMVRSESEITDMQSLRKASCAMVCAAQKQGTVVGRDVNLEKVYEIYDRSGLPADTIDELRNCVRVCKEQVKNEEDECTMMYKLKKCMFERM